MNLPRWRTQIKWTSCSPVPLYTAGQVDVAHAQHWATIFRNQITLHGFHLPAFQVWHIVRDFFFLHKILSCPWSRLYNLYFVLEPFRSSVWKHKTVTRGCWLWKCTRVLQQKSFPPCFKIKSNLFFCSKIVDQHTTRLDHMRNQDEGLISWNRCWHCNVKTIWLA